MAHLVRVPLPIVGMDDQQAQRQIEALLSRMTDTSERPFLVLEFVTEGRDANGSQFERCLSLARFLASEPLSRVRTVAYLPQSVSGHGVLPVMACEQLIIHPDAELGPALSPGENLDDTMRKGYQEIAERRRTIPAPLAVAMLEAGQKVLRVETLDGAQFITQDQLADLEASQTVTRIDTVVQEGDLAKLAGSDLRIKYRLASHMAADRTELAAALKIERLEEDVARAGGWQGVLLDVHGRTTAGSLRMKLRSLQDILHDQSINLVVLRLDSPGGSPAESTMLANFLAELDGTRVRTVAFVSHEARADAWLPVFACDQLIVQGAAVLGGPGAPTLGAAEQQAMAAATRRIAGLKQRDWSYAAALVDPDLQVSAYERQPGEPPRVWTSEEHGEQADPDVWRRGQTVETSEGTTGAEAVLWRLADGEAEGLGAVMQNYGLRVEELQTLSPPWVLAQIDRLAAQPWLTRTLLFFAFFALMSEVSAPGLGAAGFVSGVCFLLFFWLQFLNGNAHWLEALLFVGGGLCVVTEVFILPGLGVFGFGGGIMILLSLILSSQTFVLPSNSYQFNQLPGTVFTMVVALGGGLAAMSLMRRLLPSAPVLRRLMLPAAQQLGEREALADYRHLQSKRGVAVTQLTPSGKGRFGDDLVDVVSDGDLVERGANIVVTEVRGSHIVVRDMSLEAGRLS